MKLLVDGDIVVYRAGFAEDRVLYEVFLNDSDKPALFSSTAYKDVTNWIKDNIKDKYGITISRTPNQGSINAVLGNAKGMLESCIDELNPAEVEVYIDGPGNFREDICTFRKYKGNRDLSRRPLHYDAIKTYLKEHWNAKVVEKEETDDALGKNQSSDTIICSIDKDLLQIPGNHYNIVNKTSRYISVDEGNFLFHKQVLTGDTSDNIFGCPGVGDKTAEKILNGSKFWWKAIVDTYRARLPKKLPDGMEFNGKHLQYNHHSTGQPMSVSIEEYVEEVANLIFIRRKGEDEWAAPITT